MFATDAPPLKDRPVLQRIARKISGHLRGPVEGPAADSSWMSPDDFRPPRNTALPHDSLPAIQLLEIAEPVRSPAPAAVVQPVVAQPEPGVPALQEAATLFAFGAASCAEAVLSQAVRGAAADEATWLALLDLYRVTAQPARFTQVAQEFGARFLVPCPLDMQTAGEAQAVAGVAHAALSGDLVGDRVLQAMLARVPQDAQAVIRIDCRALARVDFHACAELLNWCARRSAQGQTVALLQVNRLAAAFMAELGLGSVAEISPLE